MLRIRLRRMGKKRQHYFRVVVADQRAKRDGAFLETLGSYDPHASPPSVVLNEESAREWIRKGAQPSEAAEKILRRVGVIEGGPVQRKQVDKPTVAVAEPPKAEAPKAEAPAAEPVAEAPATEEPVAEAPATEEPVAEAPATEEPAAEAPVAEAPATEEPAADAPAAEAPAEEVTDKAEPASEEKTEE